MPPPINPFILLNSSDPYVTPDPVEMADRLLPAGKVFMMTGFCILLVIIGKKGISDHWAYLKWLFDEKDTQAFGEKNIQQPSATIKKKLTPLNLSQQHLQEIRQIKECLNDLEQRITQQPLTPEVSNCFQLAIEQLPSTASRQFAAEICEKFFNGCPATMEKHVHISREWIELGLQERYNPPPDTKA